MPFREEQAVERRGEEPGIGRRPREGVHGARFLRFATWELAEEYAASQILGAVRGKRMSTSRGDRVVDVWDASTATAIEVKTGYQNKPTEIAEQIAKDLELVQSGQVKNLECHFYMNADGTCGMSTSVKRLPDQAGIPVVLHSLTPVIGRL